MLKELEEYYSNKGILSTDFHYKYSGQCLEGNTDLIKGKSAYVGRE